MDTWRIIRLWLCTAAIVAFLAAGGYARLRWGLWEFPYGWWPTGMADHTFRFENGAWMELVRPRSHNPFEDLEQAYRYQRTYEVRERAVVRPDPLIPSAGDPSQSIIDDNRPVDGETFEFSLPRKNANGVPSPSPGLNAEHSTLGDGQ